MDIIKQALLVLAGGLVAIAGFLVNGAESVGGVPGVAVGPSSVTTFTQGGGIYSTSTASNSTLLTEALDVENVVEMTLTGGAGTLTLPATSSFPGIPYAGDTRTVWIRNASTSVNAILTVAAGTGMTFKNAASSTVLLVGDTDGDNTMRLDFIRKSDSDINVYLQKYQD